MSSTLRPMQLDLDTTNKILSNLPAYAEIVLTLDGFPRTVRLMARDLPGGERRFTNLNSGTEWFLPFNWTNLGITQIDLPELSLDVAP